MLNPRLNTKHLLSQGVHGLLLVASDSWQAQIIHKYTRHCLQSQRQVRLSSGKSFLSVTLPCKASVQCKHERVMSMCLIFLTYTVRTVFTLQTSGVRVGWRLHKTVSSCCHYSNHTLIQVLEFIKWVYLQGLCLRVPFPFYVFSHPRAVKSIRNDSLYSVSEGVLILKVPVISSTRGWHYLHILQVGSAQGM